MPGTRSAVARSRRERRSGSPRPAALTITTASLLLGVYADVGQYAPGSWGLLPETGTPWVVLAFLGGRIARRPAAGALAGAGLLLLGLATYAGWVHLAYGTSLHNITNDGRGAW